MNTAPSEGGTSTRLRVGILFEGRLVEERVMPPGRDVTLGTGERCTCMVPSRALPRRWPLFRWRKSGWQLCRLGAMDDRLATGPTIVPLPRDRVVPLRPRVRGKVSVADVTVLFQIVRWPRSAEASHTCRARAVSVPCWWHSRVGVADSAPLASAGACARGRSIC